MRLSYFLVLLPDKIPGKGSLTWTSGIRMELVHQLIAGYSRQKEKAAEPVQVVQDPQNNLGHESVHMGSKRRCRVHMKKSERKDTVYGCKVCNAHLCKDGCHFTFHSGQ